MPLDYDDPGPTVFEAHRAAQKQLAEILHARLVTDNSSEHYIFVEQPELVIKEIRRVVDEARRSQD